MEIKELVKREWSQSNEDKDIVYCKVRYREESNYLCKVAKVDGRFYIMIEERNSGFKFVFMGVLKTYKEFKRLLQQLEISY